MSTHLRGMVAASRARKSDGPGYPKPRAACLSAPVKRAMLYVPTRLNETRSTKTANDKVLVGLRCTFVSGVWFSSARLSHWFGGVAYCILVIQRLLVVCQTCFN